MTNPLLVDQIDQKFSHFKGFGEYLLSHCLDEATESNLAYAKQVKLPLLTLVSHLSEAELHANVKRLLQVFFEQLIAENALTYTKETLLKWRTDTLPNIPRHGVEVSDLVLTYHARKQMLLSLIPRYTTEPTTIIAIAQELDCFFAEVELFAFGLFVDLKNEEHETFNLLLQEEQVNLEEAYEELKSSQEERESVNEKLQEEISSRRMAEQALEKERNYLKAVLENISDGIVACDEKGVLSYFNKATRDFHGLPEKQLPAEQWSSHYQLYTPDGQTLLPKEEVPLFRAYSGETLENVEMVIIPANGTKKDLLAKGQPILSATGKKEGAVVVMHDITALKKAQLAQQEALEQLNLKNQELETTLQKLQAAEEKLVEANSVLETRIQERTRDLQHSEQQMKSINQQLSHKNRELNKINNDLDNFVYTASHDLRSPVVNMEGLVLALKRLLSQSSTKSPDKLISMMEISINKLNRTIQDLTEITKAQRGLEEPAEQVSVEHVLADLKPELQASLQEARPVFEEELQVTSFTYVPRNLRSILYNLLTNALKYRSPDRPLRILIKTYVERGFVVLSVEDNGLGIREEHLPKLFTMFKRLHTHVEGTGIGLYIIKRIVENNGGTIEVVSEHNKGTLFKVFLTAVDQEDLQPVRGKLL